MPKVSVVVPCYNEQDTIQMLLSAIYRQSISRDQLEVIIADGLSSDLTLERVRDFQEKNSDLCIRVIENPKRSIPAALNQAIRNARGEYIIRLDAHSVPYPDYIERCIGNLEEKKGDNVGGLWEIRPGENRWLARAIAVAAAHPLGAGDAKYRVGGDAQEVDTVPFGAYRRSTFEDVGGFNEDLLTNEDYEFNTRIRLRGGKIWFDPSIRSVYFARKTLKELARQYWRYGYWKGKMIRLYPSTLRWRQAIPPAFVLSLLGGVLLAPFFPFIRWIVGLEVLIYLGVLSMFGGIEALRRKDVSILVGFPLVMFTMHICWGFSFLWSVVKPDGKFTT